MKEGKQADPQVAEKAEGEAKVEKGRMARAGVGAQVGERAAEVK